MTEHEQIKRIEAAIDVLKVHVNKEIAASEARVLAKVAEALKIERSADNQCVAAAELVAHRIAATRTAKPEPEIELPTRKDWDAELFIHTDEDGRSGRIRNLAHAILANKVEIVRVKP